MRYPLASLLLLPLAAVAEEGTIHHLRAAALYMPYYYSTSAGVVQDVVGPDGKMEDSLRARGGYTAQFVASSDFSTIVGVHLARTESSDEPEHNAVRSDLEITETALLFEAGFAATPAPWFACEFALLAGGGLASSELNSGETDQGWVVEGSLVVRPVVVLGPIEIFGEAGYNHRVVSVDYEATGQVTDGRYRVDGFHGGVGGGIRF